MFRGSIALLAAALAGTPAAAQFTNNVVAATGSAAPGGGTYTTFNARGPSLNAAGQIAFTAGVSGGSSGVFRYTGGSGTEIARQGQAAPGTTELFATFSTSSDGDRAVLNANGDVLFSGNTDQTGTAGLFRNIGGTSSLVTLSDIPAPGIPGVNITSLYRNDMHLSNSGRVTFATDLDAAPDFALYQFNGMSLNPIAFAGLAAPGTGNTFDNPGLFRTSTAGHITFQATMNAEASSAMFRNLNGTTTIVVQDGQAAPGGGTFDAFDGNPPPVNASGQIAFTTTVSGGPAARGLFRTDGTTSAAIALSGQTAPGTSGRTFVSSLSSSLEINASGQVAHQANLSGTSTGNFGIFRGDGTTTVLIAHKGEAAPGTGTGVTFNTLTDQSIVLSDSGGVAFRSTLTGTGVTTANDTGLWYGTSVADLTLIAREGDVFVINGVSRTLGDIPSVFEITNDGIAWRGVFSGNVQAVMFTSFTPVPEPGAVLAVCATVLCAVSLRKRRGSGVKKSAPVPAVARANRLRFEA